MTSSKYQEEAKRRWAFHHTSEYNKYMEKYMEKEPTMTTPIMETSSMDDWMDDRKYYVSLKFENMSAQDVGRLIKNINEFSQMSNISVNHM